MTVNYWKISHNYTRKKIQWLNINFLFSFFTIPKLYKNKKYTKTVHKMYQYLIAYAFY
ncbi:hypothetical protein Hanom_Chr09g00834901 [Helianthus anomalus]